MKSQPKITELVNGYLIEWSQPDNLTAKVGRIKTSSDGQIKGELEILHGDTYLLIPTQFNFSSEPTRAKYAKQLSEKLDIKIEWKEIFDYLSQKIQELVRAGDNYVEVWAEDDAPEPEQLISGLIYKGVQNIIFGEKGVSKSTLAYLLGICVSLPWHDNPLGLEVPDKPIKTLVLDWETDKTIFEYYLSRLRRGMNIPACPLYYRRCTLPLIDDIAPIQTHIQGTKADLLIIDSLGAAAGGERGELKGAESALLFNSALRKLKRTSLIIGQTSKSEDSKKKSIYGSVYFHYYSRNIFELCAGAEDYGDIMHLALFHRDCNLGKKIPPVGLRVEFDEKTKGIKMEREAVSIAEFSQKVSTSMRILEILKGGAMTQKELKETLDVSYANIGMALKRLAKQERICKVDDGWGLRTRES